MGGKAKEIRKVAFVAGDGIGPEVVWAARRCADATGVSIDWKDVRLGQDPLMRTGDAVPESTVQQLLNAGLVLKAPMDGGYGGVARNVSGVLKKLFEVFASVRRCRSLDCEFRPS